MSDTLYFVRMRGRILGPFSAQQLQDQRDRGYFSAVHEVSTDRRNWSSAGTVSELFPASGNAGEEEKNKHTLPVPGAEDYWFYLSPGGDRTGPISGSAIHDMALQGQLSSTTLVWKKGLTEWQSLAQAGLARSKRGRAGGFAGVSSFPRGGCSAGRRSRQRPYWCFGWWDGSRVGGA